MSTTTPSTSLSTQLVRYTITGFLNTGVGLGLIFLLHGVFGVNVVASNAAGYGLGWLISYAVNRVWTFRHEGRMRDSLPAYLFLVFVAFVANIIIIHTLLTMGNAYWIAQMIGTAAYSVGVFIGARYVIFRHHK